MSKTRMKGYIAVGCACTALVIGMISIALPYWYYYQPNSGHTSGRFYFGLWTYCLEYSIDLKRESTCDRMKAGVLIISGTAVFAIRILMLELVGPLLILSANDFVPGTYLHAGFALAIVSGVIALFSGGAFFYSKSVKVTQVRPNPATINF
ncbi:hypothetical protein CHS0354_023155 [Potamilus streckersoni]|uniref:Uncharacterized protein n=1 Tax=Potamilus streckersoni TaxID=2493646 RepID=A0AAE0RNI6_9BIVA|nr:hypothetical protein CHS0354_023155 [Potamilus streckersoni]